MTTFMNHIFYNKHNLLHVKIFRTPSWLTGCLYVSAMLASKGADNRLSFIDSKDISVETSNRWDEQTKIGRGTG
jgi:hypothetical protein